MPRGRKKSLVVGQKVKILSTHPDPTLRNLWAEVVTVAPGWVEIVTESDYGLSRRTVIDKVYLDTKVNYGHAKAPEDNVQVMYGKSTEDGKLTNKKFKGRQAVRLKVGFNITVDGVEVIKGGCVGNIVSLLSDGQHALILWESSNPLNNLPEDDKSLTVKCPLQYIEKHRKTREKPQSVSVIEITEDTITFK